jgi:hypothetical protein
MSFLVILTSSFEKALLSSFAHFFIGSLIFWGVYSGYQFLVRCIAGKDFVPFCELPLQYGDYFFCCAKAF